MPKSRRPRKPKIKPMTYRERDEILVEMGFSSYRDYLSSGLWSEIRDKVLVERGRRCWICRRRVKAIQVHHEYYTEPNLRGESVSGLRPTCRPCHYLVEFSDGEKLTSRQSRRKSSALRRRPKWQKKKRARRIEAMLRRAEKEGRKLDAEFNRLRDRDAGLRR